MATINKIYYNWDAYGIESSWLVTTQPTNPVEWAMYYDATNDVVKVYDGTNWIALWSGSWDVVWPSSSVDWHLAVFDGATWKIIKDWGAVPTKVSDLTNDSWFITWISGNDVTTALWYTPANSSNLWTAATKDTWTSSWNVPVLDSNWKLSTTILPWVALTDTFTVTNKSDLTGLTTAEQWDIWIVTSESKTYVLSASPYSTLSNWKEILSPTDAVTSVNSKTWAVTLNADDISDSTTTNKFVTATEKSTWSWKQDALSTQTAYTSKWTATKVPQITTNTLWQVTWITEVTITHPSQVSDTAYASSWDWVTDTAPSKNAVYDKIESLPWNIFLTQSAYDALPSSKTSDWNTYIIYS